MRDVLVCSPKDEGVSRPLRVMIEFSDDLQQIHGIFPPGRSDEEDVRVARLILDRFRNPGRIEQTA